MIFQEEKLFSLEINKSNTKKKMKNLKKHTNTLIEKKFCEKKRNDDKLWILNKLFIYTDL